MNGGRSLNAWLVVGVAVLLAAAVLRLVDIDHPPRTYFDEVYYAEDAMAVAARGVEERRPSHPPLGPALMSVGVTIGGTEPWAWRVVPALAGVGVVLFAGLAALRLGSSPPAAVATMALMAVDGLSLTMSRIAMLDVFVALFVLVGFWLLAGALRGTTDGRPSPARVAGAGVAFGLASAVKWSGILALVAAVLVVGWATVAWMRRHRPALRSAAAQIGRLALGLVVVPVAVYVASYAGWFLNFEDSHAAVERCGQEECSTSAIERVQVWWEEQVELVAYHGRLPATHPYRSSPWTWPLLVRPVLYYFEQCPVDDGAQEEACRVAPGEQAKILGLGNPVLWWVAVPLTLAVAGYAVTKRSWWAGLVTTFIAVQYLPWFFTGKEGYLFYMTPVIPFMALAVGALDRLPGRWGRIVLGGVVVTATVVFVYFSPIWYGAALPADLSDARMWLDSWR